MSVRYFKWETKHGTACGALSADHIGTNFIGITKSHVVSIPVNDPSLVEITKAEFLVWWNVQWPQSTPLVATLTGVPVEVIDSFDWSI